MTDLDSEHSTALQRYLSRHIEPDLPAITLPRAIWAHVIVIPVFDEASTLLTTMAALPASAQKTLLIIMVLNRPDSDSNVEVNNPLRAAITKLPRSRLTAQTPLLGLYELNNFIDLMLYDLEQHLGASSAQQGVGLARKSGCDLALRLISTGTIVSQWIGSTDADAMLPEDYFSRLQQCPASASAATFPFQHVAGSSAACDAATTLYELRLHHYVMGLEYANSPYAHHSLGSCLAIRAEAYAQVRGFPKRAGGEDFYILNKLAKVGAITRLTGRCIALTSRASERVPFGTGPAVRRIANATAIEKEPLYYDSFCFEVLRCVLCGVENLYRPADSHCQTMTASTLELELAALNLPSGAIEHSVTALNAMGLPKALLHCQQQGRSQDAYMRHFHQWFDGFRTLKFIHHLRNAGWPEQSFEQQRHQHPALWPASIEPLTNPEDYQTAAQRHWHWSPPLNIPL